MSDSEQYNPEDYGLVKQGCNHEGCNQEYSLPCYLDPTTYGDVEPDEYYCSEHADQHGYCAGCGLFCAGMEDFDFNPNGLCESCQDSLDREDEWDNYEDWEAIEYWGAGVPEVTEV